MTQNNISTFSKYLLESEQDVLWGLTVTTTGFQHIDSQSEYPPGNHPSRYLFSTEKGRILNEYQLIYIIRGKGTFVSDHCKQTDVYEGNLFLLFPGEWHNYKPDSGTGWDEYWIGFKGVNMDNRYDHGFFNKQKAIFNIGVNEEIVHAYKQAIITANEQNTGFQQMLAGIVNYLLGLAYSLDRHLSFEELKIARQINNAKVIMLENFHKEINLQKIAQSLSISYSWFRRVFRHYTGFSPHQYLLELKIQKSKELLTNTNLPVKEIAYQVGFENSDHFCAAFRKREKTTPISYRNFTQGKQLI